MSLRLLSSAYEKLKVWYLRRREYESVALREYFERHFDVVVGQYSYGCFDRWRVPPKTRIGRYCSFAKTARILDANHPTAALSTHPFFYDPAFGVIRQTVIETPLMIIEDDVWLSHNVTVTPGCKFIGRGAILGAGAVVTSDVPPYAIVAGAPAKILRYRFDKETIDAIEATQWWTLDKAGLAALAAKHPEAILSPNARNLATLVAGRS